MYVMNVHACICERERERERERDFQVYQTPNLLPEWREGEGRLKPRESTKREDD
jgi:hypothetical protein